MAVAEMMKGCGYVRRSGPIKDGHDRRCQK